MVTITLKQRHRYHRERCCSRKSITKTALVIAVFVGCLLLKTVMDSNNNNQQDGNYYDLIGITVQPVKVVSKYATVKNTKHNLAEVEIFSTTTGIPITQSHITATAAATAATKARFFFHLFLRMTRKNDSILRRWRHQEERGSRGFHLCIPRLGICFCLPVAWFRH